VSVPSQSLPRDGILAIAPGGRIVFAGHQVGRLLKRYFPPRPQSRLLPRPLARWVASGALNPLCLEKENRRLIITVIDRSVKGARCLHLREADIRLAGFTAREISILYGLSRGRTNQEIGASLGVATTTIKKHLETIFYKAGVRTRLAAALYAREFFPED